MALQYILYSDLRPWSKSKSKVKLKFCSWVVHNFIPILLEYQPEHKNILEYSQKSSRIKAYFSSLLRMKVGAQVCHPP